MRKSLLLITVGTALADVYRPNINLAQLSKVQKLHHAIPTESYDGMMFAGGVKQDGVSTWVARVCTGECHVPPYHSAVIVGKVQEDETSSWSWTEAREISVNHSRTGAITGVEDPRLDVVKGKRFILASANVNLLGKVCPTGSDGSLVRRQIFAAVDPEAGATQCAIDVDEPGFDHCAPQKNWVPLVPKESNDVFFIYSLFPLQVMSLQRSSCKARLVTPGASLQVPDLSQVRSGTRYVHGIDVAEGSIYWSVAHTPPLEYETVLTAILLREGKEFEFLGASCGLTIPGLLQSTELFAYPNSILKFDAESDEAEVSYHIDDAMNKVGKLQGVKKWLLDAYASWQKDGTFKCKHRGGMELFRKLQSNGTNGTNSSTNASSVTSTSTSTTTTSESPTTTMTATEVETTSAEEKTTTTTTALMEKTTTVEDKTTTVEEKTTTVVEMAEDTASACSDVTKAPTGQHVVYNLSTTTPADECNVSTFGTKVPDSCCTATGTFNMLGSPFQQFYASAGNNSCVTVMSTPEGDLKAKMQCNQDNTLTYAEDCSQDCTCEAVSTMTKAPGCYKANDMPGTMWFVKIEGCECTVETTTAVAVETTEPKKTVKPVEPAKPGNKVIRAEGAMTVKVSDPEAFCNDPDAVKAFNRMMQNKFEGATCESTCIPNTGDDRRRLQEGSVDFEYVLSLEVAEAEATSAFVLERFQKMQEVAANTTELTTSLVASMTSLKEAKNETVPEYLDTVEVQELKIPVALTLIDDSGESEQVNVPEVFAPTPTPSAAPTPASTPAPTPAPTAETSPSPTPAPSPSTTELPEDGDSGSLKQCRFFLASALLLPLLALELK